jgi:hypothetical protein
MMNSTHSLLSENHPWTLFMASLLPATMLPRTQHPTTPYGLMTEHRPWQRAILLLSGQTTGASDWPWEPLAFRTRAGGSPNQGWGLSHCRP